MVLSYEIIFDVVAHVTVLLFSELFGILKYIMEKINIANIFSVKIRFKFYSQISLSSIPYSVLK